MCKSMAEGGQRCAAHTRGAAMSAITKMQADGPAALSGEDDAAIAAYASTPAGRREIDEVYLAQARKANDVEQVAMLGSALRRGFDQRQAAVDAKNALHAQNRVVYGVSVNVVEQDTTGKTVYRDYTFTADTQEKAARIVKELQEKRALNTYTISQTAPDTDTGERTTSTLSPNDAYALVEEGWEDYKERTRLVPDSATYGVTFEAWENGEKRTYSQHLPSKEALQEILRTNGRLKVVSAVEELHGYPADMSEGRRTEYREMSDSEIGRVLTGDF